MKIDYKTDSLPLTFIMLGYMFLAVGVWRIVVLDWIGALLLLISIFLIFFKSGVMIDTNSKKIKKYNGIFLFKRGEWEDISQITNLQIVKTKEKQRMSVLTISRTESAYSYKLYLKLNDRSIKLMSGSKPSIFSKAKRIALLLNTNLVVTPSNYD